MTDENRIRELLEEVLDSGRTPEEVCTEYPDLLPKLRARLRQIRSVNRQLDALFPSSRVGSAGGDATSPEFVKLSQSDGAPRPNASARRLVDNLRRFLEGRQIFARLVRAPECAANLARRRPAVAALLVVVLLAAIVAASIWLRQHVHR